MIEISINVWYILFALFVLGIFGSIMNIMKPNREIKKYQRTNKFPLSDGAIRFTGIIGFAFYGFLILYFLGLP